VYRPTWDRGLELESDVRMPECLYELALAFLAFNDEDYARLQPTKPIIASIGQ